MMVQVTIDCDISSLANLLNEDNITQIKEKGLKYASEETIRVLMQNSPVDHGVLKSWFLESMDEEEAHIKTPAEYAVYVNDGHPQTPGRFIPGSWSGDKFRYDPKAKGGMVLKQPFVEGDHFVERSFEQLQPLVVGNFLKALKEAD